MNIATLINEAFKSLFDNKVRSILTMLGIFIGVGAVIAMMGIGFGAKDEINNQMSFLGTNNLYLTPGNFTERVRNAQAITNADVEAINGLDCIENSAPVVTGNYIISQSNGNTTNSAVTGVVPVYQELGNYNLTAGTFITQMQVDERAMVAVIGSDIRKAIFDDMPDAAAIGATIRIMGQPYRVVGVLEEKGSSSLGTSQDQDVFIPISTAQLRLMTRQKNSVSMITFKIKSSYTLDQAKEMIENGMRDRHGIFEGNPDDFTVLNMQEILDVLDTIMSTYVIFLGGIAGISLLVGGIGIMNIMLVTVTERTREIGLRKALGAKNSDILMQFLVESSVLSLVGGILGIIFGIVLAFSICYVATMLGTPLTPTINPFIVLGTTLFSIAIGLFFGIYPANRAAKLQPVIALRSE